MKRALQSNLDLKLAAARVAEARPETRSVNEQTKTMILRINGKESPNAYVR